MRLRSRALSWLLPATLVAACLGVPAVPHASIQEAAVLILLPGQPGLPAATAIATGIRSPLVAELSFRVSIETEHVDIARFGAPEEEERRLRALYGSKYGGRAFDLIIAASHEPLQFILRARDDLWPNTPVIVCAVDERSVRGLEPPAGVTVVTNRYDLEGTLGAALALLPDTGHVALVGGAGPQEQVFHALARRAVAAAGRRLDLIDLTTLPVADMLARVSTLPDRTIVLVSSYQVDGAGRRFYGLDILGPLVRAANRPVFTVFGNALGQGIVGGSLTDFEAIGREAGALGVRVLQGKAMPVSPVTTATVSAPRFDARALARWRLDERRLPPGSEVLYRQPTLWQQYRWHIAGTLGLIAAQAALIIALFVERRQRREAQARIAERLRFERLVNEVAVACTAAPVARLDEQIRECLGRIVAFLGVERGALWQPSSDGLAISVSHAWSPPGAPPPAAIDLRSFPYFRSQVAPGRDGLSFTRPDDLPPAAAAERAAFEAGGVRSFAAIPLHAGDRLLGLLAFVNLHGERAWTPDLVQQLQTLAEHFTHALVRAQSAAALESSAALTSAVLAALPGETAIIDSAGAILQTNEAWANAVRAVSADTRRALSVGANYLDACRAAIGVPAQIAREVHASLGALLRGEREEFALEYRSSRGPENRWLEIRVRRLAHLDGGAAVMHFDVTARRLAEITAQRHLSQIAHLDRVAAMAQLASSIAHELNQPLAAILSNAQAARRLLAGPRVDLAELQSCLADIVSDDQRAAEVIRHMRRLLRKTDVVSSPLALNELVAGTIALVASNAQLHAVAIEFAPATALPPVHGDPVQIQQVILNLLANAVAAAAAGPSPVRKVAVWTLAAAATHAEIGVHDSGAGVTDAHRHRIFEPFFTTKTDGLGMGLVISRDIVEAHGGHLRVENDPAGGATFRVHLPVDRPSTTAAPAEHRRDGAGRAW
jgi:signal transduction histidine kinase